MVTRLCSNCGHHQKCRLHQLEVSCSKCGAHLSGAKRADEIEFVNPEDDTAENRDIVRVVEERLARDPSGDTALDELAESLRQADSAGADVRHSAMPLTQREQWRAGYLG